MSISCTAKQQGAGEEIAMPGVYVTMVCIDDPKYFFQGFTDQHGEVSCWFGFGRGSEPTIGPVSVLSVDETRWHFTFFIPDHKKFPSVSIDFLMAGSGQHRISLLIASTTYGIFDRSDEDDSTVSDQSPIMNSSFYTTTREDSYPQLSDHDASNVSDNVRDASALTIANILNAEAFEDHANCGSDGLISDRSSRKRKLDDMQNDSELLEPIATRRCLSLDGTGGQPPE